MQLTNIFPVVIPLSNYDTSAYHYHFDLEDIKERLEAEGNHQALKLASSDEALASYKQIIADQYVGFINTMVIDQLYPFEIVEPDPLIAPSYTNDGIKALFDVRYLLPMDDFDVLQVATRDKFTIRQLLIEISQTLTDGLISEYLDRPYSEWRDEDINVLIIGFVAMLGYEANVVLPVLERWSDAVEGYESWIFYGECFEYYVENSSPLNLGLTAGTSSIWGRAAKLIRSQAKQTD